MVIYYYCTHCNIEVGSLTNVEFDSIQLGIHILTKNEQESMVSRDENVNVYIKTICEDCHGAYQTNPSLHQYDYLIH